MQIFIKAKPASNKNLVTKIDGSNYLVEVKEPPVRGRANKAIIKLLAEHFNLSQSDVVIVSGQFSRQKVININL